MQTNNIQKKQFSDGRAEKPQLNQVLMSFHCLDFYDELRTSLKNVLNANIGLATIKKPKRRNISTAITVFYHLFNFNRSLLSSDTECSDVDTGKLLQLANKVNDGRAEDVLYDCLAVWVHDYFNEKATRGFTKLVLTNIKLLNLFIDECEKIGNALEEMEVSNG